MRREGNPAKLISMTRTGKTRTRKTSNRPPRAGQSANWALQDAKARFSELVRKVRSDGPQHVTVHGRDEVVVISEDEYRRLSGAGSGRALIGAMQASPYREIEIEPSRTPLPVRDVDL